MQAFKLAAAGIAGGDAVTAPIADGAVANRKGHVRAAHQDARLRIGDTTEKGEPAEIERDVVGLDADAVLVCNPRDVCRQIIRAALADDEQVVCVSWSVRRVHGYSRLNLVKRLHRRSRCAGWRETALGESGRKL